VRIDVVPLTGGRWPDLEALFREGGDPRWCWCMYWRLTSSEFSARKVPELREDLRRLAAAGPAPGLLAYLDGRAVGWISVGPREDYGRLERSRTIRRVDDQPVWSVVCFVVSRDARGRGVARALLEGAVRHAAEHGATILEGYPVDPGAATVPAAAGYTGLRSVFEHAGFSLVGTSDSHAGGHPRVIMRRALSPGPTEPGPMGSARPATQSTLPGESD
jgi:GNAT superfamily N-acetyltransferase